ncbi:hypothetical protein [Quadrisphaera sp. DSM 44207]|uniref:DUF6912 family protein n=1 Tax=Quadrisphaera sp. DSM 44207 TaxID=1881057 RepID=UPI000887045E|nr:hypothetical protein [Quadrisphaera sp. DSM 44207]SDQ08756.1 hypothetical protein SAMN05428996_0455 [Quadrisphaera sp. DSM 44207]
MRVYLPATLRSLARAVSSGSVVPADDAAGVPHAHAVTPALREWYTEGDLEELELAALLEAAASSLRLLALEPSAPPRRLVLAADVPDRGARPAGDPLEPSRSAVLLDAPVPLAAVVSAHVDEEAAEPDVRAAVDALPAADAGDEDAAFLVDSADGHDLLWYDATELADLVAQLLPPGGR